MKKRVLSMVLALSMMLTLFPASAFAAGDTGGGINPDKATPQSVDTENAADLTSATTITAQDVANSYYPYAISKGGTYELEGGDYGDRYIVIDATEPVTLNIKGNITCKSCFLSVYGSNRDVTVNGGESTVTANDQTSSNAVFYLGGQNNKLTINSGTFQNSGRVINAYYSNNDTLTVNGGNFISTSDNVVAVYGKGSDCSTFDIQNATLTAKAQCTGVVYLQADSYDVSLTNCTVTAEDSSTRAAVYVISGNNEDASSAHKLTLGGTTELLAPCGVYLRHDCDLTLKDSARIVNSNPQSSDSSGIFYQNGTDTSISLEGGTIEGFGEGVKFLGCSTNAIVVKLGNIQFQNNVTDLYIPNNADGEAADATYKNIMLELEAGLSSPVNVTFYDSLKRCKFIVASANNADKIQYLKSAQGKFVLNDDSSVSFVKVVKQDPPSDAYCLQFNGQKISDHYVNLPYEKYQGKTLADVGFEAVKTSETDTNDYGAVSITYYGSKMSGYTPVPDETKVLSPENTKLEPGQNYFAVVQTAGNDAYKPCKYVDNTGYTLAISVTKPDPTAKDYKVTLTVNKTEEHELGTEAVTVSYNDRNNYTVTGASVTSSSPDCRYIYYIDTATKASLYSAPTTPGTYQVYLEVRETDTHASGYVTSDKWVFTIGEPKQDPPENAYVPRLNGDSFINPNYEDVKGKTLAELGIKAERNIPDDTTDYGETSLHFYSDYTYGSGFGAEISADTIPEIGKTYYVTVKTAGNDAYNAREYTQVFGFITVRYAPKADNYKVTVTFDDTPYDLADVTAPVVVPYGTTYTVDKEIRNASADAGRIFEAYYRAVDSTDDDAWSSTLPTEPGTYQISLEVGKTDTYNSALHLTSNDWVFTISNPKQDPDAAAYAVTYDGSKQKSYAMPYSEVEENNYKTLGDLPLGYEADPAVDVSKYGTPSLHYYKATQNKGGLVSDLFSSDCKTEYQADEPLTPGAIYYVVVETVESDDYTAARYTDNGMYILIGKPDPASTSYKMSMMYGENWPTLDNLDTTLVIPYGTSYTPNPQRQDNNVAEYEELYVREVGTTSWSAASAALPTEPGTYEISLKIPESDSYASVDHLTNEKWVYTIGQAKLDVSEDTLTQYFDFENGKVVAKDSIIDHLGEITTLYYDADGNQVADLDLDEDGLPKNPGTYTIRFTADASDYYEAIPETKTEWTYTVLEAPTADQYNVTLNGKDITEADPIDYDENLTNRSKIFAHPTSINAGNVTAYHYVMLSTGISYDTFPTVPGTYQVYLDVRAGMIYAAKNGLTDPAWQFTIGKSEPTPSDFTYDSTTNTITSLPYGVSSDNVTIQYYKDGKLVKDFVKDANGKDVPRMAGTYQVGFTVEETEFYKGDTFTGAETGWTYEKEPNLVTSLDFEIISQPKSETAYTGQPVTALEVKPHDNISPVNYKVTYCNETTQETTTEPPTDAGSYSWWVSWEADDNTQNSGSFNGTFTITEKAELDNTAVTVTVPEMREGADNSFEVTVSSNDETLSADDLEITYYNENGTELTEAPTTEGTYFYSIKIKADAKTTNFQPGATLTDATGNTKFAYTIKPAAYTVDTSYGDVDYEGKADGKPLTAGTEVTVTAPADTETSAFRQWIITVDGEEIDATVDGLAKLGVTVDDDAAALELLQKSPLTFTMPKGDVKISALTSNPQQEAFDQAAGTALIVTGAAAATGAVYYFGTTAYIRSQLPEGMAVPQNREQLAVALWTLAGKPATESTTVFTDVAADSEALPAIRWAVETGVLSANTTEDGTSFYAGNYVTRAETAYRIYKLQQQRAE